MSAFPKHSSHFYEFGPFRLDVEQRLLFRDSEAVPLTPKLVDTLFVLIENHGRLLEKNALMDLVWPNTFVEESSLAQNISLLRKALGDESGLQYIVTLPKRGYRFIAEVQERSYSSLPVAADFPVSLENEADSENREAQGAIRATELPVTSASRKWRFHATVVGVVVCLSIAAVWWKDRSRGVDADLRGSSIAVLPFKTLGIQDETDLAGLGMADALILRLAQMDQVTVLPTSSVIRYLHRKDDASAIGRELGVDVVLDGTLQRTGRRVRVTAQLIRLRDGKTIWGGKFDDEGSDLLAVQDELSSRLAQELALKVEPRNGQRFKKRLTDNAEAYELYARGLYFWNKRTAQGLAQAIDFFTQATQKDPDYALAYASLADAHMLTRYYRYGGVTSEEVLAKARPAALKAIELDPTLSEAHAVMGMVKALEGELPLARSMFRRAVDLNPNLAMSHLRYGFALANQGMLDAAIEHMLRAHQLDPLSPTINTNLSAYFIFKAQYDEGIKYARLALEIDPNFWQARINLAEAAQFNQQYDEAVAEYKRIELIDASNNLVAPELAYLYAINGNRDKAIKLLAQTEKTFKDGKAPAYHIALAYVALSQPDEAIAWLNRAADSESIVMPDFRYSAKLQPIRNDPRFRSLEDRVLQKYR